MQHCRAQFEAFSKTLVSRTESLEEGDSLRALALSFESVARQEDEIYAEGPMLVSRLFTTYPDFAPTFPRELLWFLGGECLHYLTDEEISIFQQLDEMRGAAVNRGEVLDFQLARAKLMNSQ